MMSNKKAYSLWLFLPEKDIIFTLSFTVDTYYILILVIIPIVKFFFKYYLIFCLTISNIIIEEATATFKDSASPGIGILSFISAKL